MNRVDGELVLKKMEKDEKKLERTKRKLAKEIEKVSPVVRHFNEFVKKSFPHS